MSMRERAAALVVTLFSCRYPTVRHPTTQCPIFVESFYPCTHPPNCSWIIAQYLSFCFSYILQSVQLRNILPILRLFCKSETLTLHCCILYVHMCFVCVCVRVCVQVPAAQGETWAQISWGQFDGITCGAEHSAPATLPAKGTAGVCW